MRFDGGQGDLIPVKDSGGESSLDRSLVEEVGKVLGRAGARASNNGDGDVSFDERHESQIESRLRPVLVHRVQ